MIAHKTIRCGLFALLCLAALEVGTANAGDFGDIEVADFAPGSIPPGFGDSNQDTTELNRSGHGGRVTDSGSKELAAARAAVARANAAFAKSIEGKVATSAGGEINSGHDGRWFDPQTADRQGLTIKVDPETHTLELYWFTHTSLAQHWLVGFGPYSGDSATVSIYATRPGRLAPHPAPEGQLGLKNQVQHCLYTVRFLSP